MKINFIETYDIMDFKDVAFGDVFLDAEEDNKCIYMKIDTPDFNDNAYNLTEKIKSHFNSEERVYALQAELNVFK